MLLFILVTILCLGAIITLLLRETQTGPRQLGLMAASIRVSDQETVITTHDLNEAVKKFANGLGVQPTAQSAHEAVFTIRFKTGSGPIRQGSMLSASVSQGDYQFSQYDRSERLPHLSRKYPGMVQDLQVNLTVFPVLRDWQIGWNLLIRRQSQAVAQHLL